MFWRKMISLARGMSRSAIAAWAASIDAIRFDGVRIRAMIGVLCVK